MKCLKKRLNKRDDVDCVRAAYRIEKLENALEALLNERLENLKEEADYLAPYLGLLNEERNDEDIVD